MNEQSRTIAIVSYVTFLGWIIALILRQGEKPQSEISRFHLRQALGVHLIIFAYSIIQYVLSFLYLGFVGNIIGFVVFFIWLIGLIGAIQAQFRYIPFIGRWFEENFDFVR